MFTSAYAVQRTTPFSEVPLAQGALAQHWRCDYQSFYHPGAPSGIREATGVVLHWSEPLRPRVRNFTASALYRFDMPGRAGFVHDAAEHHGWYSHLYGSITVSHNGVPVQFDEGRGDAAMSQDGPVAVHPLDGELRARNRIPARRARKRRRMMGYLGAVMLLAGARFNAQGLQSPRTRWWEVN